MKRKTDSNGTLVTLGTLLTVLLCTTILVQLNLLVPTMRYVLTVTGMSPKEAVIAAEHLGPIGKPLQKTVTTTTKEIPLKDVPIETNRVHFVEVVTSCDDKYEGACVRARTAPSATATVAAKLRTGIVLRTVGEATSSDGTKWYKIGFDEWLRYGDRVSSDAEPSEVVSEDYATGTKKIIVDRSEQQLYAYDGDTLFLKATTSTGLLLTPTPRGTFHIFKKVPTRYMQGPLPYLVDQEVYDLPGVPWNMYFTSLGAAIHGAYWHNDFGNPHSHGCVNLPPDVAKKLYYWADVGTTVTVRD
jgi:hypothetical protein